MRKIIYLLLVLMLVIISVCACDTNEEIIEDNNVQFNDDVATNQYDNVIDEDYEIIDSSDEQKKSGDEKIEVLNENNIEPGEKVQTEQSQTISVSAASLSNKTNAWGFVRQKNEARPQFSAGYTKVLDDYEGIYAGNSEKKVIYLTFDEGYENGYTGAILDTLKEKDCLATFFVTKPYVKQNQELVQRMIDEGHIVGNHIPGTSMYHIKIS